MTQQHRSQWLNSIQTAGFYLEVRNTHHPVTARFVIEAWPHQEPCGSHVSVKWAKVFWNNTGIFLLKITFFTNDRPTTAYVNQRQVFPAVWSCILCQLNPVVFVFGIVNMANQDLQYQAVIFTSEMSWTDTNTINPEKTILSKTRYHSRYLCSVICQ